MERIYLKEKDVKVNGLLCALTYFQLYRCELVGAVTQ